MNWRTKDKIRQKQLKSWATGNRKGHPITEETKKKIGLANKKALIGNIPSNRKLNDLQVEAIRYHYKKNKTLRQLAKRFNSNINTISKIVNKTFYVS